MTGNDEIEFMEICHYCGGKFIPFPERNPTTCRHCYGEGKFPTELGNKVLELLNWKAAKNRVDMFKEIFGKLPVKN